MLRLPILIVGLSACVALTPIHAQQITTSSAHLAPGITLLFETATFLPDEHDVVYDEGGALVINGCVPFFGTDNAMPGRYLRQAHVLLEGRWHALDASCMYTCEACSFEAADVEVTANPAGQGYRLEGRFSDGAGTYYASWLVTPTGTARTRIVAGPDAPRLFMIDSVIEALSALGEDLEAGAAAPDAAERIRSMLGLLERVRHTGSEQR